MNSGIVAQLELLRKEGWRNFSDLTEKLRQKQIHIPQEEVGAFLQAIHRRGRLGHPVSVPDWLLNAIVSLGKQAKPQAVVDVWSGVGFLVERLRQEIDLSEATALTCQNSEAELGKYLFPDLTWRVGNPLDQIQAMPDNRDLIVGLLPFGMPAQKPLKLRGRDGNITINGDYAEHLIASASQKLSKAGRGLFAVSSSFFSRKRSLVPQLEQIGLSLEGVFELPISAFEPMCRVKSYLVVMSKQNYPQMFVARLTNNMTSNNQVLENFVTRQVNGPLESGRLVPTLEFRSMEALRAQESFDSACNSFGWPILTLGSLSERVVLGRSGPTFTFPSAENEIYIPLIGASDVTSSSQDLSPKLQNYAQIQIKPELSNARFIARFLNSELGKKSREGAQTGGTIPKLNLASIQGLRILVPDVRQQNFILDVEASIAAEQNALLGLQNELHELQQKLWASPNEAHAIKNKIETFSKRISKPVRERAAEGLETWLETLPFPLASILRTWQATASHDYKEKQSLLLYFFEAATQFAGVILLSAFSTDQSGFSDHLATLHATLEKQKLSFSRPTFGTWKVVVEYFTKQTRALLNGTVEERALCGSIFADQDLILPTSISGKAAVSIMGQANSLRNNWSGHGGFVGQEEAQLRNQELVRLLQQYREAMGNVWQEVDLLRAVHCRPRKGVFENEVALLMGSNSEFLKENRTMSTWLDVEQLYISNRRSSEALRLIPLIKLAASPRSSKNACYFFNRVEQDGLRFVSYHFSEKPEIKDNHADALEAIISLSPAG